MENFSCSVTLRSRMLKFLLPNFFTDKFSRQIFGKERNGSEPWTLPDRGYLEKHQKHWPVMLPMTYPQETLTSHWFLHKAYLKVISL